MTIEELFLIIQNRKKMMPQKSYIASLFRKGNDSIIQKIGEESTEVIIEAKNSNKNRIISEVCDLLFHLLILLSYYNFNLDDIKAEFSKRNKSKQKFTE